MTSPSPVLALEVGVAGCWWRSCADSTRCGLRRYRLGDDLGVVSKLVNVRSGTEAESCMTEAGRSKADSTGVKGSLVLEVREWFDGVPFDD